MNISQVSLQKAGERKKGLLFKNGLANCNTPSPGIFGSKTPEATN